MARYTFRLLLLTQYAVMRSHGSNPWTRVQLQGRLLTSAVWLQDAGMRDLILNVRADEACHSHVNHTFAGMQSYEDNPFVKGNHMVA